MERIERNGRIRLAWVDATEVYRGGRNLNRELLENGHAVISTQYCDISEFGDEAWAKVHGC